MYYETNELYHFGVKGMKWGKRKAQRNIQRADRTIRTADYHRRVNKEWYNHSVQEAKIKRAESSDRFGKIKDAALKKKLNDYAKEYANTEIVNKYDIARAKAKKDPKYKETSEYKKSVSEGRKLYGQAYVAAAALTAVYVGLGVLNAANS